MLSRKESFEFIKERLEYLQLSISNSGSLNLNDLAIHTENFFRDLLSLVYGWQLENANTENQNAADIDLIDRGAKLAIQVTARNDRAKIAETLDSFHSKPENAGYRLKFMLVSKEALKYKAFTGHEDRFDVTGDIVDVKKVLREINDFAVEKLNEIAAFLETEIRLPSTKNTDTSVAVSNESDIKGVGNITVQGATGSNINITIAQNETSSETEDQRSAPLHQKYYPAPFIPDLKYFVGREELLANLGSTLQTHRKASIHDISGLGKTFTCYKYADDNRAKYPKIFLVNCAKEAMMESLARLGQMLHSGIEKAPQKDQAAAFKNWLETNADWLAIYDNVDEPATLKPFVPNNTNGDCLFTSNDPLIRNLGKEVSIGKLETKNAAVLLFRRSKADKDAEVSLTDDSEQTAFWQIVEDLDGLPVALNTTGAFIEQQGISYSEYLENLEASPNLNLEHGDEFDPYKKTVLKAFALAIDANTNLGDKFISAAVDELYRVASLIAPDDIHEEFLRGYLERNSKEFATSKEQNILWQRIRRRFQGFDLFKYDSLGKAFSTHRLIQKCIVSRFGDTKISYCEKALNLLEDFFPLYDYNNKAACERYYHHTRTALENADKTGFEAETTVDLYYNLGEYQRLLGNIGQAEKIHDRQLRASERVKGNEHTRTGTAMICLAMVYRAQDKYEEAIAKYEKVIEIYSKELGEEHEWIATTLNNLAAVYYVQGTYDEAIKLYEKAIKIDKRTIGKEHPDYAVHLNNLALVYDGQGKYDKAIRLLKEAAEITGEALDKEHPAYATRVSNLAVIYAKQEKYSEALLFFEEALRIRKAKLPHEHPNVAITKKNIKKCKENLARKG